MQHHGRLDLGGADAVAGHVDHVVHPAGDPEMAVGVAPAAVTGQIKAAVDGEVGGDVPVVVAVHVADGGRPRALDGEQALARPLLLVALLIDDDRLHAEEGPHGRAWLHAGAGDGQRHDHDAARLSLPPRIHDRAPLLPDHLVIPPPGLGVDRLTDRAEQLERRARGAVERAGAEPHQGADGGGRRIELGDAVLVDDAPQPPRVREGRHALEDQLRGAIEQRAIGHVRVACDPAAVGGAEVNVAGLQVEDVLGGGGREDHVPTGRV
mmetsp:Transcript_10955/g.36331  ORF Transcript_10955/g.36331 Transcript_10955/m.36331 type:complete len:266 (-) Transcript_10955:994-1791(-)